MYVIRCQLVTNVPSELRSRSSGTTTLRYRVKLWWRFGMSAVISVMSITRANVTVNQWFSELWIRYDIGLMTGISTSPALHTVVSLANDHRQMAAMHVVITDSPVIDLADFLRSIATILDSSFLTSWRLGCAIRMLTWYAVCIKKKWIFKVACLLDGYFCHFSSVEPLLWAWFPIGNEPVERNSRQSLECLFVNTKTCWWELYVPIRLWF